MRLVVGIPLLDTVSWKFFLHTTTLIAKLSKKYKVRLSGYNRTEIDRARQCTCKVAVDEGADRILFIDDDTLIPFNTVEKLNEVLIEHPQAVSASGFCYQRGFPFTLMVYNFAGDPSEWGGAGKLPAVVEPLPTKPFRVAANGMGVSLINVSMLRYVEEPWFDRVGRGTEDFYFYEKVHKAGLEAWVHPEIQAIHLGDATEVSSLNADKLRTEALWQFIPGVPEGRAREAQIKFYEEEKK